MTISGNVFLVGPMGVGKTSVGKRLAKLWHYHFYDSDQVIVEQTGVDIPFIFEKEGEAGFRQREASVIEHLSQLKNIVLATGGGAVLQQSNRNYLRQHGQVIYLYCSVNQQFERTRNDQNRPLLQTKNPYQKLQDLMRQRDPLYRVVADYVINTDNLTIKEVIEQISHKLEKL